MPRRGAFLLNLRTIRQLPPGYYADQAQRCLYLRKREAAPVVNIVDGKPVSAPAFSISWEILYKAPSGRRRRYSLGTLESLPPVAAREKASELIARIKNEPGFDPAEERRSGRENLAFTMQALFDRWQKEHVAKKLKPGAVYDNECRWNKHLKVPLGSLPVKAVTGDRLSTLFDAIGGVGSNRCRALVSSMMTFAVKMGARDDNPVRRTTPLRETSRERLLSNEEIAAIGAALVAPTPEDTMPLHPASVAVIRLALLTAMRRGELVNLTWPEVDLDAAVIKLKDSKTGRRTLPLSPQAVAVLRQVPREKGRETVFAGWEHNGDTFRVTILRKDWLAIVDRAGLTGTNLHFHDLRHAAASTAAALGLAPSVIQHLLGHSNQTTTQRYVHSRAEQAREVANAIADALAPVMAGGAEIVQLDGETGTE